MKPPELRLAATSVVRRFGYRTVLRDVSLTVHAGEFLLLLGPNGAGKTTLLRVLAGLLVPASGTVQRSTIVGLVGHEAMLYDALTARENLRFFARVHRVEPAAAERVLDLMGLQDRAGDRAGTFSRGMLQRLAIARALLSGPGVLLLDEPLTGLDRHSTTVVLQVLADLRAGGTALMAVSHRPAEFDGLATGALLLEEGALRPTTVSDA